MIKMDVMETDDGYKVHAEMPGVKKEDVNVEIEGNRATIDGETRREKEMKEGDRVLRSERYFGNVYRAFTVPAELNEALSETRFAEGILELKLVKKAPVAGKKLTEK